MTLEHETTVCQVPYAQPTAPTCVVWSWGRLHKALGPISARQLCYMCMPMRPNKAETAVHGCHYLGQEPIGLLLGSCLGDMAVRMPDRGLVLERVTCFYCSKRVTLLVNCVKCVSIPIIKTRWPTPHGWLKIARPTPYQGFKNWDPPLSALGPACKQFYWQSSPGSQNVMQVRKMFTESLVYCLSKANLAI